MVSVFWKFLNLVEYFIALSLIGISIFVVVTEAEYLQGTFFMLSGVGLYLIIQVGAVYTLLKEQVLKTTEFRKI